MAEAGGIILSRYGDTEKGAKTKRGKDNLLQYGYKTSWGGGGFDLRAACRTCNIGPSFDFVACFASHAEDLLGTAGEIPFREGGFS